MDAIGQGDYTADFSIRKLDQLQEFADAFNAMIKLLRAQISIIKEASISLQRKIESIPENEVSDAKKTDLKDLKNTAAELTKFLSRLKT